MNKSQEIKREIKVIANKLEKIIADESNEKLVNKYDYVQDLLCKAMFALND